MTTPEFVQIIFAFAFLLLLWTIIDFLRRILDALHTIIAHGNMRRQWVKEERE